jgi:hypothetical protein
LFPIIRAFGSSHSRYLESKKGWNNVDIGTLF